MTDITKIPDASSDPSAYADALLDVLGGRQPLDVMEETPGLVAAAVRGLDGERLSRSVDGEWSPAELVGHLYDVELVQGFRMRVILTAELARYPGYDQEGFARLPRPGFETLLGAYLTTRQFNVHVLRSIPAESWERVAWHEERGLESLTKMVRLWAGHDIAHLDQLGRAVGAARG